MIRSIDYVIPVPLHSDKKKKRGFNQAALLSSELVKRLNSTLDLNLKDLPEGLKRNRSTLAQRSISGEERFANLEGAFQINEKYRDILKDSSVLLVDDIMTTGATADRCARILRECGVTQVHFICLTTGNYYLKGSFRERDDEEFLKDI